MVRRALLLLGFLAGSSIVAQAHVRVFPDAGNTQAPACGYTKFVVRVPVEKPIATTRIDLFIPKGITVFGVQPKPNWQFNLQRTRGIVTTISWTGGRLMPNEFDEFAFLAATPRTAGTVSWNAWQYYEDGSIVKWTGAPGAETPHSITSITAGHCKK
jgi:uncharacterized protein YcnI